MIPCVARVTPTSKYACASSTLCLIHSSTPSPLFLAPRSAFRAAQETAKNVPQCFCYSLLINVALLIVCCTHHFQGCSRGCQNKSSARVPLLLFAYNSHFLFCCTHRCQGCSGGCRESAAMAKKRHGACAAQLDKGEEL